MDKNNTFKKIQDIVAKIPEGKVSTYQQIALLAGRKDARVVVWAIHKNTDPIKLPCHRIIRSDGNLATGYGMGGIEEQKRRLLEEGIEFNGNKVDLEKYLWTN